MKAVSMAVATLALATSASAFANQTSFGKDQAVLSLQGLDLSTVDGQRRLAIRMDAAARDVCGDGMDTIHLSAARTANECRTAVLADIRAQIETRMAQQADTQPVQLASNK